MKETINVIFFLFFLIGIIYVCVNNPLLGKIVLAFYGLIFLIGILFMIRLIVSYRKSLKN